MARLARVVVPAVPHHVTQRGNRRQPVFFQDEDYLSYLRLLKEWCEKSKVEVWAYCLMPNHVHLIAVPSTRYGLALALGEAHRRYTRLVNLREDWRGYLWQGRFASYPMSDEHLAAAVRYVELNPVRAHLVERPEDYRWSSARVHLDGSPDLLVLRDSGNLRERIVDWQAYLKAGTEGLDNDIIRQHLRTGRPHGDRSFLAALEKRLHRTLLPQRPGPKPKQTTRRYRR
jgi:putative transposase